MLSRTSARTGSEVRIPAAAKVIADSIHVDFNAFILHPPLVTATCARRCERSARIIGCAWQAVKPTAGWRPLPAPPAVRAIMSHCWFSDSI